MSEYVIYKDEDLLNGGKPTAHAIVIGIGEYYYLSGGRSGRVTKMDGGLQQLSSPPVSAKMFTNWLLDEFNSPQKPLSTISLLISEKDGPSMFTHSKLPNPVKPQEATIENVKKAVREWKSFGDRNENNLILFFFCGHGVARGLEGLTLLLADYGETDDMPMEGAINFAALHRGMTQCKASQQCFFIDACRKVNDIATKTTASGDPIIQDDQNRPWSSELNKAIFYSTIAGEAAYGRKDKSSFYTEELIRGLNGLGSNKRNADGKWRVSTGDLNTAIHYGLSLRGEKIKEPQAALSYFEFHELKKDPIALAIVNCDPKSDNALATLYCEQKNKQISSRLPAEDDWEILVPPGEYNFIAQIENRKGEKLNERIWPPYQDIKIEVAP